MASVVTVYEFPDLETRFVSRLHPGLSALPGGWTQFLGVEPGSGKGADLDLRNGTMTVGGTDFAVVDQAQTVTAWLALHDDAIAGTTVIRKQGEFGEDEATTFLVSFWRLEDYSQAAGGGGYEFSLTNVLQAMQSSLYEDLDGQSYRLAVDVASGTTSIALEESPKGKWREPGFALFYDDDAKVCELVAYDSIGSTSNLFLLGCTRRKFAVGPVRNWESDTTQVMQVWVKRGDPLALAMAWLTTTEDGTNGPYDAGDGDGLGLPITYFDVDTIEAVRAAYAPAAVFTGDALTSGTAQLFVESGPIEDVKEFVERHVLRPFGLYPQVDPQERWAMAPYYGVPLTGKHIGTEWAVGNFSAAQWKRGAKTAVNNLSLLGDWIPLTNEYALRTSKSQATSIARFKKSKLVEIEGRGMRTGKMGFPDYGSAHDMDVAGGRVVLELGNPGSDLDLDAFWKHREIGVGGTAIITMPNVPDLALGRRGLVNAIFVVTSRNVNAEAGKVELRVRLRRAITRPAFVAADSMAMTYGAADETERQRCYVAPGSGASFGNGDPAYRWVP